MNENFDNEFEKSKNQIVNDLRDISLKMISLGSRINYFAGFNSEFAKKGL